MKRLIAITIMALLLSVSASAHPGGTDALGGHYNRTTGEYHYHHGMHEHDHPDGICPYGYTEETEEPTAVPVLQVTQSPTEKPTVIATATPEPEKDKSAWWNLPVAILLVCVFSTPGICLIICIIGGFFKMIFLTLYDWIKNKIQTAKATKVAPAQPKPTVQAKTEPPQSQKKTVTVPSGYAIGSDGLPYKTNRQYGWGREFNVFVTNNGEHYHRSKCKIIKGKKRKLMHRYNAIKRYEPCTYCKPKGYIDEWYIEYKGADKGREQLTLKD